MTTDARAKSEKNYNVVVRWSDIDNAYLAELTDFAGVRGYGDSRELAIKQVEDALQLALETHADRNWEPPKPDPALGASGQFRLRLPRQLHARLSSAATQNGVSLNQFVVSLIADSLARVEQLPKNAIEELQHWFDATLQIRLNEAFSAWTDVAQMSNYTPGAIGSKPFHSASKWAPMPKEIADYESILLGHGHGSPMLDKLFQMASGKVHLKVGEEIKIDPVLPDISKSKG